MLRKFPKRAGYRIKNIQQGTIVLNAVATATATLTSVVVGNAEVVYLGISYDNTTWTSSTFTRLTLTDATTLTATRGNINQIVTIAYMVVEWEPAPGRAVRVKSIQRGTIAMVAVGSATATITAVVVAKSVLRHLGHSGATTPPDALARLVVTNTTTITADRVGTGTTITVSYEVTEWEEINV